jgi:small subunit ribosomal protein S11
MAQAPKNNVLAMLEANPSASAAAADATAKDAAPETGGKRKVKKTKHNVPKARACVCATENNTIVTITDLNGKVLSWASSGSCGFKGARKSTPYAAKVAAEKAMTVASPFGIQSLEIEVKGIGPGREQAIRGLQIAGVNFESITDTTPIAHGGCRPKRPRRV